MPRNRVRSRRKKQRRRVYIREWRKFRGLTLEQLSERVGITHASLSRIERGLQDYTQSLLEDLAEALQTDPASLLIRPPDNDPALWSLWDRAEENERRQIEEMARIIVRQTS